MLKGKRHPDSDTFPQAVKSRVQIGLHHAIMPSPDETQGRPPTVSPAPFGALGRYSNNNQRHSGDTPPLSDQIVELSFKMRGT